MLGWLKGLFSKRAKQDESPEEKEDTGTYIWGILQGPVRGEDIPDHPFEDDNVMMILKVSVKDEVFDAEFWFEDLDGAYKIVSHFHNNIDPIRLDSKEYKDVE